MTLPHSVAVQCIFAAHAQIATFARESFTHDGRGVVMIDFPIVEGTNVVAATMNYDDLMSVRELAAERTGSGREDADVLLRMVETYDPETQAVVMATVGEGWPVSVTVRLDHPTINELPMLP